MTPALTIILSFGLLISFLLLIIIVREAVLMIKYKRRMQESAHHPFHRKVNRQKKK